MKRRAAAPMSARRLRSLLLAEQVAQELRYQLANAHRWEPIILSDLLVRWIAITPNKICFERPL